MHWIQVNSNEGLRPFLRVDSYESENKLTIFKNLCIQNHWANFNLSIKLGTNHPWVKSILVYSNEGPHISKGR